MKSSNLILLIFSIFISFSCNDPCDLVDCGQNGICIDGDCECDPGYSGKFCENQTCAADFFVGTFSGTLKCDNSTEGNEIFVFTKISETVIRLTYENGIFSDFELDLTSCEASNFNFYVFFWDTQTITLVDEGIEFRVDYGGSGSNYECVGILTS